MKKSLNKKRIIAYLLDIVLIYILITAIISIRFINPTYDKYIDAYEKYNSVLQDYTSGKITVDEYTSLNTNNIINVTKYSISASIVIVLVIIGYFVFFQKYNKGQTLGKKIMKIKVVGKDHDNAGLLNYLLRIIPMYYIMIGSVIPIIINSIVIFMLKAKTYTIVSSIIVYITYFISIISFFMIIKRDDKRGLHDLFANTKVVEE